MLSIAGAPKVCATHFPVLMYTFGRFHHIKSEVTFTLTPFLDILAAWLQGWQRRVFGHFGPDFCFI